MKQFITSVTRNKCPNCLGDNFFTYNNMYSFGKFDKMNQVCSKCGMDFRQEPGFYLGAAIVSYAMQAGFLFLAYIFLQVLIEVPFWYFLGIFAALLIVLIPFTFRISRLIWINMLGKKPGHVSS